MKTLCLLFFICFSVFAIAQTDTLKAKVMHLDSLYKNNQISSDEYKLLMRAALKEAPPATQPQLEKESYVELHRKAKAGFIAGPIFGCIGIATLGGALYLANHLNTVNSAVPTTVVLSVISVVTTCVGIGVTIHAGVLQNRANKLKSP